MEKILKAELIRRGWFLEKTHDLLALAKELRTRDPAFAERCRPLSTDLAEKYFAGRYPGFDLDDADWPELRAKIMCVGELLYVVKARIEGRAP
jgi:HEPN domain-containing protein